MPKITINEKDLTLPSGVLDTTDVAFILGFTGVIGINECPDDAERAVEGAYYYDKNIGESISYTIKQCVYGYDAEKQSEGKIFEVLETQPKYFPVETDGVTILYISNPTTPYNEPKLCTTVAEFESYFGVAPWIFQDGVKIPSPNLTVGSNTDDPSVGNTPFSSTAVPNSKIFYNVNDYEKSYVYAKDLLNLGLPVIYYAYADIVESKESTTTYMPFHDTYTDKLPDAANPDSFELVKTGEEGSYKYQFTGDLPTDIKPKAKDHEDILIAFVFGTVISSDKPIQFRCFDNMGKEIEINEDTLNVTLSTDPLNPGKYTLTTSIADNEVSKQVNTVEVFGYIQYQTAPVSGGIQDFDIFGNTGIYKAMCKDAIWNSLLNKGEIPVKYITTGGYPIYEYIGQDGQADIIAKIKNVAQNRGDCIALIDHTDKPERSLSTTGSSVWQSVNENNMFAEGGTYFAMFTPWGIHSCSSTGSRMRMPASFAYLKSLATAIKTNNNWLAMAGVSRGIVPNLVSLCTNEKLTNAIADSYQVKTGVSINAITDVSAYGHAIWGNRTLKNNVTALSATSFLNIRNMMSDIKKQAYTAAIKLMFEHNNDVLWANFRAELTPLLDRLVTGYGIESYSINKLPTIEHGKLCANIVIVPVYAVEEFEITVTMTDSEVNVD